MKQFERVLEEINVLKGVSYGVVSTADIEAIAAKTGVEGAFMSDLYCFLRENGIAVYSEESAASMLTSKKDDQRQSFWIRQFKRADDVLEHLLVKDMDPRHRQSWIKTIENSHSKNLKAVFALKQQGLSALEIANACSLPIEEVYRLEYCICNRFRRVGHSHKPIKKIKTTMYSLSMLPKRHTVVSTTNARVCPPQYIAKTITSTQEM